MMMMMMMEMEEHGEKAKEAIKIERNDSKIVDKIMQVV